MNYGPQVKLYIRGCDLTYRNNTIYLWVEIKDTLKQFRFVACFQTSVAHILVFFFFC